MIETGTVKRPCNNYLEGGRGLRNQGGHRGKSQLERGGWMENLIHTGGSIAFFHYFSQTGKMVEELLEFKHLYLLTLELDWENINSRCFDL